MGENPPAAASWKGDVPSSGLRASTRAPAASSSAAHGSLPYRHAVWLPRGGSGGGMGFGE
jgi:hypothetical protein